MVLTDPVINISMIPTESGLLPSLSLLWRAPIGSSYPSWLFAPNIKKEHNYLFTMEKRQSFESIHYASLLAGVGEEQNNITILSGRFLPPKTEKQSEIKPSSQLQAAPSSPLSPAPSWTAPDVSAFQWFTLMIKSPQNKSWALIDLGGNLHTCLGSGSNLVCFHSNYPAPMV